MRAKSDTSRRQFLKASTAAALSVAANAHAGGNDKIKIGLIGCGGRGTGAAGQALRADSNVELVAVGDAFPDRLQTSLAGLRKQFPDKVKVDADKCFVGFDAYQKVIASGVDLVVL